MNLATLTHKSKLGLLSISFMVAISIFSGTAHSAIIAVTQRDSTQFLSFADQSAFTDASQQTTTVLSLSGNTGDTLTQNYTIPHGETNFTVQSSTPAFSVSAPIYTAGNPNDNQFFTITANNNAAIGNVTVNQNLGVNVAPVGAINSLSSGVTGGYNYLDEFYNPTANQTIGSPFSYTAIINGNYSAQGITPGGHQLININNGWTIDQNFVFDGTNTLFSAHIAPYALANQINLEYRLFGAPTSVPVPAALWLFGSGFGLLGFLGKRRPNGDLFTNAISKS